MANGELPVVGDAAALAEGASCEAPGARGVANDGLPVLGRGPMGTVVGPTERSGGGGNALLTSAEVLARAAREAGVSAEPSIPDDAGAGTRPLWAALGEVRDPELPVSLVDLGLIYDIRRDGGRVEVEMTFTAMGCPCMMVMEMDVRDRLLEVDGVDEVEIDVVWDPPWNRRRMTARARKILRNYGVVA